MRASALRMYRKNITYIVGRNIKTASIKIDLVKAFNNIYVITILFFVSAVMYIIYIFTGQVYLLHNI